MPYERGTSTSSTNYPDRSTGSTTRSRAGRTATTSTSTRFEGSLLVTTGYGNNPNTQSAVGYVKVALADGRHWDVDAGRRCVDDRGELCAGPMRWTCVEPLERWTIELGPNDSERGVRAPLRVAPRCGSCCRSRSASGAARSSTCSTSSSRPGTPVGSASRASASPSTASTAAATARSVSRR